jgi:UDP-N-acetylmuramoylalanine--D-glutamate ligase
VTGTKGKSTTSSILGHLLTGLGRRTMVGGNIGAVPYDPDCAAEYDYWVIEVSSYQATDLASSPPVTVVTSLHPDHLPWHGGVERYYRDKLSACSQPGAELTVANGDSNLLRSRAALLAPRVEWVSESEEPGATWMAPLGLPGRHNRRNALIARRVLRALGIAGADDDAALRAAAAGYVGLPSRLATIGVVDGVIFVDDSLSTNVLPTLAALDAFPGRRIALIVGGEDRGIDYAPLAVGVLAREEPTLVLTLPDSGPRISAAFESAGPADGGSRADGSRADGFAVGGAPAGGSRADGSRADGSAAGGAPAGGSRADGSAAGGFAGTTDCPDLDAAVAAGYSWARPGGIVLLSPAAPSFGHFRDYQDRAEAFARAMRACATAS